MCQRPSPLHHHVHGSIGGAAGTCFNKVNVACFDKDFRMDGDARRVLFADGGVGRNGPRGELDKEAEGNRAVIRAVACISKSWEHDSKRWQRWQR